MECTFWEIFEEEFNLSLTQILFSLPQCQCEVISHIRYQLVPPDSLLSRVYWGALVPPRVDYGKFLLKKELDIFHIL